MATSTRIGSVGVAQPLSQYTHIEMTTFSLEQPPFNKPPCQSEGCFAESRPKVEV